MNLVSVLLWTLLLTSPLYGTCPSNKAFYPCTCSGSSITCGGREKYDLKTIFKSASDELKDDEKHFTDLIFTNTAIDVWEEDVFNDITFEYIFINYFSNLTRIHTNAFTATSLTLRVFASNSLKLTNDAPNFNTIEALSKCVNISKINIFSLFNASIPSHAFSPLKPLKEIHIQYGVTSIGEYAFYQLPNIEVLLFHFSLTSIEENAFNLRNESNKTLFIDLSHNNLGFFTLPEGVFSQAKRPLRIYLNNNKFTFLDEKVFSPFFKLNKNNTIDVGENLLNCSDCRNAWILNDRINLEKQILNAYCNDDNDNDNKELFDVNFNCFF